MTTTKFPCEKRMFLDICLFGLLHLVGCFAACNGRDCVKCCLLLHIFKHFFLSFFSKFFIHVNKKNQLRLMFATTPFHMQANKNSFLSLKKHTIKIKTLLIILVIFVCFLFIYLLVCSRKKTIIKI